MSWTVCRLLMAATLRARPARAHRPDGLFAVLRQPVLHGEQRRPGSRPAADLRIDVGHVGLDRPRPDDQARGDLLVRHPAGEQPQDLALALGQLARYARRRAGAWPAATSTASTASASSRPA